MHSKIIIATVEFAKKIFLPNMMTSLCNYSVTDAKHFFFAQNVQKYKEQCSKMQN